VRFRLLTATLALTAGIALSLFAACSDLPVTQTAHDAQVDDANRKEEDIPPVGPGGLRSPVRIALDSRDQLFVSDYAANAVLKLQVSGRAVDLLQFIPIDGRPMGVAWARGKLIVGNSTTHSVDVYRAQSGERLHALGGRGTVGDPVDIAVAAYLHRVFVLDAHAKNVKVFSLETRALLQTISGPGLGPYDLQNPTGLALDESRGQVIVSDYGDPRVSSAPPSIKFFSFGGDPVKTISGKRGMLGQRFSRPQGMAIDGSGRLLLVDALAGEVQVLDRETGSLIEMLGTFGQGPGQLWLPLDVVVGRNEDVFVTNNRLRRVEVFSAGGPGL
jgi:DNA-binding beta-propeller fold protein YncE